MKLKALGCALLASCLLQACVPLIAGGVVGGVAATADRRTYGEQLMDTEIEHKFNRGFSAALEKKTNTSATAYNRWVLLTGQAIDEPSKAEVEAHARALPNVREVFNEISIGYPSSFSSRSNDVLLTSSVKTRIFGSKQEVSGHHVKIVSESGTVYLMGLLTEAEAQAAIEIARTTAGVRKVVNMIEIISAQVAEQRSPKNLPPEQSAE